ncbi:MAG: LytR C-terminal domain-containing protein, partial [Gemmatimonadota bacterium]
NGAGAPGLARDATHVLRARGFDVVYFGNAGRFDHVRSVVLDRVGDTLGARAVAASLGIDSVAAAPDRTLMLDVSVVLGEDWPPAPARDPGWTARLRGLVDDAGGLDRAGNDSAGGG